MYEGVKDLVGNAFMVSEVKNDSWLYILDEIQKSVKRNYPIQTVMHTTGPLMISRIFEVIENRLEVNLIPYKAVTPLTKKDMYSYIYEGNRESFMQKVDEAYCAHYFFGSWDSQFSFYN